MTPRYFVFVEFSDLEVHNFLDRLRIAFSAAPFHDTPHVTVRGPYLAPPEPKLIEGLSDRLHGQGVLIADVGMFQTGKGYAVFLYAKSKLFDEVWWKPDFSVPSNRRIPHVTIYESNHREKATAVMDFLRAEQIEIVTYGVELTVYTSKQQTLLPADEVLPLTRKRFPQERLLFREGLFDRAAKLGAQLNDVDKFGGPQRQLL